MQVRHKSTLLAGLLIVLCSLPGSSSFDMDGKMLLAVSRDGVTVVDPWRRTTVRNWSGHEPRQAAFAPDGRWMAEVDDSRLRIVDLEKREGTKEILEDAQLSPQAVLFGEDASKLWVVAGATKSLLEVTAPRWGWGRNLPLQGPAPRRAWRCGSRGLVFQPPSALTEVDLSAGKVQATLPLQGATDVVTDPGADHVLALCGAEWRMFDYGHPEAVWRAPAKTEFASQVCLLYEPQTLGGGPQASDTAVAQVPRPGPPQMIVLDPGGEGIVAYRAMVAGAPAAPAAESGPSLDAYVPGDVPKVEVVTPAAGIAQAQLTPVWRLPLPSKYSSLLASPDGKTIFLGGQNPAEVLVLNAVTHQAIARLPLPSAPKRLLWP